MDNGVIIPERKFVQPVTKLADEGNRLLFMAELPGATEEKIRIALEKDVLTIASTDSGTCYRKEIELPCEATIGKKKFSDGILELYLEKVAS